MPFQKTEQEQRLEELFSELTTGFKEFDKLKNVSKQEALLKELNEKIKDGKALIKEFEREARNDSMPAGEMMERKTGLVNELNNCISIKKTQTQILNARMEVLGGASDGRECESGQSSKQHTMTTQQLVAAGRKEMKGVETTLGRAEKVVEDTIQIGTQTAAELRDQTKAMERVVDDLDDIEFTMKKARKVLTDLTRGILTDKFIRLILLLILLAVIAAVVLTVIDDDENNTLPKPREITGSTRRLLTMVEAANER